MFLAAIVICTTVHADSCSFLVNNKRVFGGYEECYRNADQVAQALIAEGQVYSTSPYCFPLEFGEPA